MAAEAPPQSNSSCGRYGTSSTVAPAGTDALPNLSWAAAGLESAKATSTIAIALPAAARMEFRESESGPEAQ